MSVKDAGWYLYSFQPNLHQPWGFYLNCLLSIHLITSVLLRLFALGNDSVADTGLAGWGEFKDT